MNGSFDNRDYLDLRGLRFNAYLGVDNEERDSPQGITIDLKIYMDLRKAGAQDQFHLTIDYREIQYAIRDLLLQNNFKLIEAAALSIVRLVLEKWPAIQAIRIDLKKPTALPDTEYACVSLFQERGH